MTRSHGRRRDRVTAVTAALSRARVSRARSRVSRADNSMVTQFLACMDGAAERAAERKAGAPAGPRRLLIALTNRCDALDVGKLFMSDCAVVRNHGSRGVGADAPAKKGVVRLAQGELRGVVFEANPGYQGFTGFTP